MLNKIKREMERMGVISWLNYGWVGSIIGITGVVLACIFYIKSIKKKSPCYQYRTNTIVGKKSGDVSKDIEIKFKGKVVESINRTVIAIWNDGNDYLDSKIILEDNPLKISFKDGEILSHQVKSKTSDALTAYTKQNKENEISVDFNYLDQKEGFCIEIMHTSESVAPLVSCTIKGIKEGFSNKGKIIQSTPIKAYVKLKYMIISLGIVSVINGFISLHLDKMKDQASEDFITKSVDYIKGFKIIHSVNDLNFNGWAQVVTGVIYIAIVIFFILIGRQKTPKSMDVS